MSQGSQQQPARPKPTFGDILTMLKVYKDEVGDEAWKAACQRVVLYNQNKMSKQDVLKVSASRNTRPLAAFLPCECIEISGSQSHLP